MPDPTREPDGWNKNPVTWLILSDKIGDNAQTIALSKQLGWSFETKTLLMKERWELGKPRFKVDLNHIDFERSDALEPPWPDLIITSGRRLSQAALWIKSQALKPVKIVLVGRPRKWIDRFDLIVAPPQYRLPDRTNVHNLAMPLMRPDPQRIREESGQFHRALQSMPRPLHAVFVGGQTQPFGFGARAAASLHAKVQAVLKRDQGSAFWVTSRRTGKPVVDFIYANRQPQSAYYIWGQNRPEENPYQALLGLADRFIVTGDSISMAVESIAMQKPVAIFELPLTRNIIHLSTYLSSKLFASHAPLGGVAAALGFERYNRDIRNFHQQLYEADLAVPLGSRFKKPAQLLDEDLELAANRVRNLYSPKTE